MAEGEAPGGDSGVDQIVAVGNELAEMLRRIIANPIVRIQDAAEATVMVDDWRKVTSNYNERNTNVEDRHNQE